MAKGKLILICQTRGDFAANPDGSLSYNGGEAHAVDISSETVFDDLKTKLAELCDLEYNSLSLKYFIPGNKKTLISLSNDKDFKRMYDFYCNSVTADIYVTGREGFHHGAVNNAKRTSGRKSAGSATPGDGAAKDSGAVKTTPKRRTKAPIRAKRKRSAHVDDDDDDDEDDDDDSEAHESSPIQVDGAETDIVDGVSPADTVKKRRRTAAASAIAASTRNGVRGLRRKSTAQRRYTRGRTRAAAGTELGPARSDRRKRKTLAKVSEDGTPEELVASWKDGIVGEGQDFEDVKEFRDVLQKYAIAHRFAYKLKRNDHNRASGNCVVEGCPWRIWASWVPSEGVFRIKKFVDEHKCGGESWNVGHPGKKWLVGIIKERLRESPHQKTKEIANGILQDFGVKLNYSKVRRGVDDARQQLQGSYSKAYGLLPWYCDQLEKANPGSLIKLVTGDDKKFQRLIVSFEATVHGFQSGCRPLLFLEAIKLHSKYHEVLLTATALDGDDAIFPVALAVVDVENDESWRWFLEELRSAISTSPITFVFDKDKGLAKPICEVFENAHVGYNLFYLMESFIKNLRGPFTGDGKSLPASLLAAASTVRIESFKMCMEHIKQISSSAYDWIMQNEPENWANCLFRGEQFGHITFNVAEQYIKWADEARALPIIKQIELLRCKVMEFMDARRADSSTWTTTLTPSKEKELQEEIEKACGLEVLFSSDTLLEVHDDRNNIVDLNNNECSCIIWRATGLPCRHAIAVFNHTNRELYDYCSSHFTADNFRATYAKCINPASPISIPLDKEAAVASDDDQEVLPPAVRQTPTLQKKTRLPKNTEGIIRRSVCCTRCKAVGHNKVSCKVVLPVPIDFNEEPDPVESNEEADPVGSIDETPPTADTIEQPAPVDSLEEQAPSVESMEEPAASVESMEEPAPSVESMEEPAPSVESIEEPAPSVESMEEPAPVAIGSNEEPASLGSMEEAAPVRSIGETAPIGSIEEPASISSIVEPASISSIAEAAPTSSIVEQGPVVSMVEPAPAVSVDGPASVGSMVEDPAPVGSSEELPPVACRE